MHPRSSTPATGLFPQLATTLGLLLAPLASVNAQDWSQVDVIQHSTYQAVNGDGSSAYPQQFPIRLRGVVLNDNEDWLDPTGDYDPGPVHLWQMGAEAEIFVQAVNLDGTSWDPDTQQPFDDFGGTAAWMGQNYGNHFLKQDPSINYTDQEWYDELDRLGLWSPGTQLGSHIRAGDLVEIRARGGLNYAGKMNVNEQHSDDAANDFEIVLLEPGFGLPEAAPLSLAELLDPGFDSSRQAGGEHYQSTLVTLQRVTLDSGTWTPGSDVVFTDGAGRTVPVHVGRNITADEPSGWLNLTGILNQVTSEPAYAPDGYFLMLLDDQGIAAVPEPAAMMLLAVAGMMLLGRRRR